MMQIFDPQQEFAIIERRLPHWTQAGTIAFITWRTWDSMPEKIIRQWQDERSAWLRQHGIDPTRPGWEARLRDRDVKLFAEMKHFVADRWNDHLDECHGSCVLRIPEIATIVSESLQHFNGNRYELTDYVAMPNHVHLLVAFPDEQSQLAQCESWKHYTAVQINKRLRRKGRFWQQDAFDHLVRSPEQFTYLQQYIADNPNKAKLPPGQSIVYSSRST